MLPEKELRGHSISVNTTGKPHIYKPITTGVAPPTWKRSEAVKSFKETLSTQHRLHFKLYFSILCLTALCIGALAPWYYDMPPITGDAARTTGSSVVQGVHQLSVMITTFIALAIPLTANFYTPRLVDIFLKDATNIAFLTTFSMISAVSVFMNSFLWSVEDVPMIPYCIMIISAILGWVVIIPYYYYVMRFLDPEVIVDRVARLLVDEIQNTVKRTKTPTEARHRLNRCILQLGDIGFRSMDRKDTRTGISCIQALCFALDIFREQKYKIDPRFFQVEVSEFPMLSKSGLSWLSHTSLWVEEQILRQIQKSFTAAIGPGGMPGIVSFISLSIREQCIPLMNNNPHDRANLELCIRFINTFLREAINQQNIRALFNMFYQYTSLAKDLCKWSPDLLLKVVKHISHYGKLCGTKKLEIAVQTNHYDLGNLCGYVYRVNSPYANEVLEVFLDQEYSHSMMKLEKKGIIHSRMILGSFLLYLSNLLRRDLDFAINRVIKSLLNVPIKLIRTACRAITETVDEMFWEITDRIVNFDYVPPQQRPYVETLAEELIRQIKPARNIDIDQPEENLLVGSIDVGW